MKMTHFQRLTVGWIGLLLQACGTDVTLANAARELGSEEEVAPNGHPYCKANGGLGYGTLFDCTRGLTCAKTDQTYTVWCVVKNPPPRSACPAGHCGEPCDSSRDSCCSTAGRKFACWTDPETGLEWQNPPQESLSTWSAARRHCEEIDLGGYTDWRLPGISELRTLIRGCDKTVLVGGSCGLTDGCESCYNQDCTGCAHRAGPGPEGCFWDQALEGRCGEPYWSSIAGNPAHGEAWYVYFSTGSVGLSYVTVGRVRCVRTAHR